MLALDTVAVNAVALAILPGMGWATPLLLEAALIVATVGLGRYPLRGDVIG